MKKNAKKQALAVAAVMICSTLLAIVNTLELPYVMVAANL
jgi:hypothetical protein